MLSQTAPISDLARNYLKYFKLSIKKRQPVIFLRRNKPVGGLVHWQLLEELMALRKKAEEKQALMAIKRGLKEFRQGKAKVLTSLASQYTIHPILKRSGSVSSLKTKNKY